ncbi:gliding motility lipoprotein GldH [Bacteroidota bacterium]
MIFFSGIKSHAKVFLLIACIFFLSCDANKVFEENIEIPAAGWDKNYFAEFIVDISDTNSFYNFYVNIRNGSKYPNSNLFLFINTKAPNGDFLKDTVEFIIADERGKWLGSGLGNVWSNQIQYKRNIKFRTAGQYIFTIQQGMRIKVLPSIKNIGLRIETSPES